MAEGDNQISNNRSMFRDFIASISTMRGDLSNITAPPFVLDTKSTVELPSYWSENPTIFCAPTHSEDPAERAMLVLKWYLSCLRSQNYMGHSEDHGVKKPLNAFLGELFIAKREDAMGTTKLVSEQVSHHPPITACRIWNDEHGVSAAGYTRQTITFNGSVSIKQTGHALFTLSKRDESYLIPLPELKVKGVLTGSLYPELIGKYYMPSTSGYTSVIDFSGKGWFGSGAKHGLEARVFKDDEGEDHPLYTIMGTWNKEFTIHDVTKGEDIETFDVMAEASKITEMIIEPLDQQDSWETRRAWRDVISSLNKGDMKGTTVAKSKVEQGQRQMRKDEVREGVEWTQGFFKLVDRDETAELLTSKIPGAINMDSEKKETKGVWAFDFEKYNRGSDKPYHGDLTPDNSHRPVASSRSSIDSATSGVNTPSSLDAHSRSSSHSAEVDTRRSLDSSRAATQNLTAASPVNKRMSIDSNTPLSNRNSISRRSIDSWLPFRHNASNRMSSQSPRRSSEVQAQGRRGSTASINSTKSISDSINNIDRDMPGPQVTQVFNSENARVGSQIEGLSLEQKWSLEEALRDQYMSAKPKHSTKKNSRLSVDSTRAGLEA